MNKRIQTTELSFDQIKQSIKTYLSGQSQFSDYEFEGSGLSILLDVLALNTHYNALYLNLALNEAFIDTASKRSSVVSKAKELGYTPRSSISATALVNVIMIDDTLNAPDYMEIPEYATFTATVGSESFNFYTTQTYIAYKQGNQYIFNNVVLREGALYEYAYEYVQGRSFIVPNKDVDITTFSVTVQENVGSSTTDVYVRSNNIVDIAGDTKVYFIHENYDGFYELQFGNGDIGNQLDVGNYIRIKYLISSKDIANGARTFSYNNAFVTTITPAYGGSEAEDIESVRWNAPRHFTAQNRCVTANDYKYIIKNLYNVKDVNVWGGDEVVPPQYGKVFLSIVPKNSQTLSNDEKDYILNYIIKPRKSLTITPEFVDPTYMDLSIDVKFKYDPNLTIRNAQEISSLVFDTIIDYSDTNLATFDGVFRTSRISTEIDNTEDSIISNDITLALYRDITPIYNTNYTYNINLGNTIHNSPLSEENVISSGFYISGNNNICYIDDVPPATGDVGKLRLFYLDNLNNKVSISDIGTINYSKGIVNITGLNIRSLYTNSFRLKIVPGDSDIYSSHHQFLRISPSLIKITPFILSTKGL